MKLIGIRHIMHIKDIVAQLKPLEVIMSDSFLVHFILCILPYHYAPFKISYNTHKDKWFGNKLLTMCVQEEDMLLMEEGDRVNLTTFERTRGIKLITRERFLFSKW